MERNGINDYDVIFEAARLDLQTGQTGSATKALQQDRWQFQRRLHPGPYAARGPVSAGWVTPTMAQQQIDAIEKLAPDSLDFKTPENHAADHWKKSPGRPRPIFDKLPEGKPQERLSKGQQLGRCSSKTTLSDSSIWK